MMPPMDDAPPPPPIHAPGQPARLPLGAWLREGLRAGFFLRPRVAGEQPTPLQVAALLLVLSLLEIALARFEVAGAAQFDARAWLAPWWSTAALLLLAWWTLPQDAGAAGRPAGLAAWFALWMAAVAPANTLSQLLGIAQAHEALPQWLAASDWAGWALYLLLWAWTVGAVLRLTARFGADRLRLGVLALGMIGLFGLAAVQFPDRPWQTELSSTAQRPRQQLSQELFEAQQALLQKTLAGIAPERAGVVDVYAVVFSPYGDEDVFLRESSMVATLLAERFDAKGRLILLANHPAAARTHPWATLLNLERAVQGLAARMDRKHDLLVVYLTSHGAGNFELAAAQESLNVDPLSPGELRRMLDQAGIRNRVIVVSACYSGGWVGPLASDATLVMTAADASHTSYGCGRLSPLTFFGRAVFDEQLRRTHSFEQAFAAAVPLIRQREIEAGKGDGFSNPQISVGANIRPVLRELERRLDAADAAK